MYLLEMAMNLLLCGFHLFTFCWTQYHTDLEQMLKTSCKVGLQPEGGNYRHLETVINQTHQLF